MLLGLMFLLALAPDAAPAATDDRVDAVLKVLESRGQDLQTLSAEVVLTETDLGIGDQTLRRGRFILHNAEPTRFRVVFEQHETETRILPDRIEYLLDNGLLTERQYDRKPSPLQVRRQVVRPGEKVNFLRLGEGPFPLPIGQSPQEVKQQFGVEQIPPAEGDPAGLVHLRLTPLPSTRLERQFSTVDLWVDMQAQMPLVIETLDANQTTQRRTELSNVRVNEPLASDAFVMAPVDEQTWRLVDEAYQE